MTLLTPRSKVFDSYLKQPNGGVHDSKLPGSQLPALLQAPNQKMSMCFH